MVRFYEFTNLAKLSRRSTSCHDSRDAVGSSVLAGEALDGLRHTNHEANSQNNSNGFGDHFYMEK